MDGGGGGVGREGIRGKRGGGNGEGGWEMESGEGDLIIPVAGTPVTKCVALRWRLTLQPQTFIMA